MKKIISLLSAVIIFVSIFSFSASAIEKPKHDNARNGVVYIRSYYPDGSVGAGTGFAIGKKNEPVQYIATCHHVIEDAELVEVYFSYAENDYVSAEVVLDKNESDVAVLKLPSATDKRIPLTLCPSKNVDISEDVYIYGYPNNAYLPDSIEFNTMSSLDIACTPSSILKPMSQFVFNENRTFYAYLLAKDSTHGNSGGPVVNADCEVVGLLDGGYYYNDDTESKTTIIVAVDELIALLKTSTIDIPYTVHSAIDPVIIIIAAVAAVAILLIIIIICTVASRKKKAQAGIPASLPVTPENMTMDVGYSGNNTQPSPSKVISLSAFGSSELSGRSFCDSELRIGRDQTRCNVLFSAQAKGISKFHCTIRLNGAGATITDNGSTFGTFLGNGTKLSPNAPYPIPNGGKFFLAGPENSFEVRF